MTYQETLTYLYNSAPLFQHVGKAAYKEGLENTLALDEYFGHPHRKFRTIHVAGTNGKGSCSHTLAAILQSAGYRVGLYTSPHLVDFRERIRINGVPVSQAFVVDFMEKHRSFFEPLHPSFFELATAMAFHYFASQQVDVAVIEVGLGGRLDCTNIIHPDLCLITNISFDHVQFLGNTLAKIAGEKAGIIKPSVPVVIGETTPETKPVFLQKAAEVHAPIYFAEEEHPLLSASHDEAGNYVYQTTRYHNLKGELGGLCQEKNTNTLLTALPPARTARLPYNRNGYPKRIRPRMRTDRSDGTLAETLQPPCYRMRHGTQRRRHPVHRQTTVLPEIQAAPHRHRNGKRQRHQRRTCHVTQRCQILFHPCQRTACSARRESQRTGKLIRTVGRGLSRCQNSSRSRTEASRCRRLHICRRKQFYRCRFAFYLLPERIK